MRRRDFIVLIGSLAAVVPALAQRKSVPVVGYVGAQSRSFYDDRLRVFHDGLEEVGFREGRDVFFEYRWAEGHVDRFSSLLSDLATRHVDVIVVPDSVAGSVEAKRVIKTIPVVFGISTDPVQLGLVDSWSRPGGNLTGMVLGNTELVAKRMELLHQLTPTAQIVGLLVNPDTSGAVDINFGQKAAQSLGLELRILNASSQSEIATVIERLSKEEHRALLVGSDTLFYIHREWIARMAADYALTAIYDRREYVQAGGLMSYGANLLAFHQQLGVYVGRILRGEKPNDLPVVLPVKFEFAVNLKAAKRLGIDVPPTLLARADEVIE